MKPSRSPILHTAHRCGLDGNTRSEHRNIYACHLCDARTSRICDVCDLAACPSCSTRTAPDYDVCRLCAAAADRPRHAANAVNDATNPDLPITPDEVPPC